LSEFFNIKIRNPRSPLHARTIAISVQPRLITLTKVDYLN
jgi:hypothetical protein